MVDILTKKLMKWKLIKIHENTWKNFKKMIKPIRIHLLNMHIYNKFAIVAITILI